MTNMTSLNIGLSAALCLGIFSLKSFGEDSQATLYFDHFVEIDHAKESQFKDFKEFFSKLKKPRRSLPERVQALGGRTKSSLG